MGRRRNHRPAEIQAASAGQIIDPVGYGGKLRITRWTPGGPCFRKLSDPPYFGDFVLAKPDVIELAMRAGREALGFTLHHVTVDYVTEYSGTAKKMMFDVEAGNLEEAQRRAATAFNDRTKGKARKVNITIVPEGTYR